jgi:hypothetical protein
VVTHKGARLADVLCAKCGRADAAGAFCSLCGHPYAEKDYRPHPPSDRKACLVVSPPPEAVAAGWGRGFEVDDRNRVTRHPDGFSDAPQAGRRRK